MAVENVTNVHKYTSKSFSIKHLLEMQDRKVFRKVSGVDRHPSKGTITQEESIDLQFKESNKSVSES